MSYKSIFRLDLRHTYYADNICRGLAIQASAANASLMQNLDLLIRDQEGAAILSADADQNGNLVHIPVRPFSLCFYLVTADQYFNNYTDLPYYSNEKICAFNNIDVRISGETIFLHTGNFADADNLVDRIGLNAVISITGAQGPFQILNAVGATVSEGEFVNGEINFSAPDGKEGLYRIQQNGKELRRVCVCNPPMGLAVAGFAEVWFDPAVPADAQFIEADGKIRFCQFAVAFDARKAYWNYLIVSDKYLESFQNIAVTDSSVQIFFRDNGSTTLFNGKKAFSYTSPQPYQFSQQPEQTFQLRKNCIRGINNGTVLVEKLPTANGSTVIPPENKNPGEAQTELIVYL